MKAHELIADGLRHGCDIHEGMESSAVADVRVEDGNARCMIRVTLSVLCPLYPDQRDIAADALNALKLLASAAEDHARYHEERKEIAC